MTTQRNRQKKELADLPMRQTELEILLHAAKTKRPMTHRQIGARWGSYMDRDPATAYRAIGRLVERGHMDARPIRPQQGRASQKCYLATTRGAEFYNLKAPTPALPYWESAALDEALQYSEMMLERESTGWIFVPRTHAHRFLIGAAKARLAGRGLTDTERHVQDLLGRMRPVTLPLDAIAHGETKEVRLIVQARKGVGVGRQLKLLPPMGLMGRVDFELVGIDQERLEGVERLLKTGDWDRQGMPVTVNLVPHMLTREDPNTVQSAREQRYPTPLGS